MIGPDVKIISANHARGQIDSWVACNSITIEQGVWLGANVVVLPESYISSNSVVAASAVVSGKFPPNSLIAGVPARLIKELPPLD